MKNVPLPKTHRSFHSATGISDSGGVSSPAEGNARKNNGEHQQQHLEHHHPLAFVPPHHSQGKADFRPRATGILLPEWVGGEGEGG